VQFDLSALAEADRSAALETQAAGLGRSLDHATGPLLRGALFDLGRDRPQRLLLVIHQTVIDDVSWGILLEELARLEQSLASGELPLLPSQTTSFCQWARELDPEAGVLERDDDAAYWLAGERAAVGGLPLDSGVDRDPGTPADSETLTITLDEDESRALLEEVPQAYNTDLRDALLTALAEALVRWTGHEAVLLDLEGTARDGRNDLAQTVGGFGTLFPVTLELPLDPGPAAAIKAIKEQLRAIPRQGIGYGLLRYFEPEPSVAQQLRELPAAEVRFRCADARALARAVPAASRFALAPDCPGPTRSGEGRRSHLVAVEGNVVQGLLQVRWTYDVNRFRRSTIEKVAEEFLAALRALAAHCLSPEARGYTPSDFPLAGLDQRTLDQLVLMVEDGAEEGLDS
jgi:non-ribosomal peptide synthase protein (TIGR01720 family)